MHPNRNDLSYFRGPVTLRDGMTRATGTDGELVAAAQGGSAAAFEELLARHAPTLEAVAVAVASRRVEPEEVAAEAASRAWRSLGKTARPESFGAWLRGIAANVARELLKGARRRPRPLGALEREPSDHGAGDPAARPEETAEEAMLAALDELPEPSREVLVMKHLSGMSYRDMARALEITEAGVNQRLTRARKLLAEAVRRRRES